jgi:uncharacterized membrane protein YkvA (DUF1232 family)
MPMKIVVEISDADLEHYRAMLDQVSERVEDENEQDLVRTARMLLEKARRSGISGSVEKRLEDLGTLVAMLDDRDWGVEGEDRQRIATVIRYFSNALDVIPDDLPGLGYVDDALMTEIILRELREDIGAYRAFCAYRDKQTQLRGKDAQVDRKSWLADKRRPMFLRIKRRRNESRRHGSRSAPTPGLLAYRT